MKSRFHRSALGLFSMIVLSSGLQAANIVWNTAGPSNNWNATDANWTGGATVFTNGDNATFSAATGEVVTVGTGITPAATVISGNGSWTFQTGSIGGGTLGKSGTGSLTLSAANSFSSVSISGGPAFAAGGTGTTAAIKPGNNASLGTGLVTLSNTASMNALYSAASRTIANDITLSSSAVSSKFYSANAVTVEYSGKISGGVAGATLFLDASAGSATSVAKLSNENNDFLGTISVWRGVLAITGDGCLGNSANVLLMDQTSNNGGLRFDANNINLSHAFTAQSRFDINVNGFDATISGNIGNGTDGTGAFTIKGGTLSGGNSTGTLRLSGNNNNKATYTISANTKVIAASANALGDIQSTTVSAGATVAFDSVGTYTVDEPLTLNGGGCLASGAGVGALENLAGSNSFSGPVTLASASTIGVTTGSLTLSGVVSGAFNLTKIGSGPLTLSGNNTYSGTTVVNSGMLTLTGDAIPAGGFTMADGTQLDISGLATPLSLASDKTLSAGRTGSPATDITGSFSTGLGTLSVLGTGVVGTLTTSANLTLNGGSVALDLSPNSASGNDRIVVTGTLDLNAPTDVTVNRLSGVLEAGSYVLAQAGSITGSLANLNFVGLPTPGSTRQSFTPSITTVANALTLDVAGTAASLVWNNAANTGKWSTSPADESWNNLTAPDSQDRFYNGDLVTFPDIISQPTQTITLDSDVNPGSLNVNNSAAGTAYTLTGSGNITGTSELTKSGSGILTITGTTHDFTGTVNLNGGDVEVLMVDNATYPSCLGMGSSISFDGGGLTITDIGTAQFSNRTLTVAAGGGSISVADMGTTLTLSGAVTLGGELTIGGAGAVTMSGASSGAGTLAVTGTSTLAVSGASTRTGDTSVASGSTLTCANAASLGSGAIIDNGSVNLNLSTAVTLVNTLSGAGGLTKSGAGVVSLTGTNTAYSGALITAGGGLTVSSAANTGSGPLSFTSAATAWTITGTASTFANDVVIGDVTGNVTIKTPNNSSTVIDGTVSGGGANAVWFFQGGDTNQNTGALTLNGTNTLQGTIDIQRGPLILGNASAAGSAKIRINSNSPPAGALQLGNFGITNPVELQAGASVGIASGNSAEISGVISSTAATAFVKVGAGKLTLTNANTYTGATTVSEGTLVVNGALASTAATAVDGSATLGGTGPLAGPVTVTGTIAPGSGAGTIVTGATVVNGTYACEIDGASADNIQTTNLSLGASSVLNVSEISPGSAFPYVIATYSGNLTGTFLAVTPGYTVNYGTGTNSQITVSKGTVYDSWATTNITAINPLAPAGFDDDADGDGIANGLEWILGGGPLTQDAASLLTTTATASGGLILTFKRAEDSIGQATLTVEWDTDLSGGFANSIPINTAVAPSGDNPSVAIDTDATPDSVTVTIPAANAAGGKIFARLHAELP